MTPIPIQDLQQKSKNFKWTGEAEKALKDIKELLISPPVLRALTLDSLFQLESDTSHEGVGGTLFQKQGDKWVIISYHSKRLPASAKKFRVTELELTRLLVNIHRLCNYSIISILRYWWTIKLLNIWSKVRQKHQKQE